MTEFDETTGIATNRLTAQEFTEDMTLHFAIVG